MLLFNKKRPTIAARELFIYWDNTPVHTAAMVKEWMAAKDFMLIEHPPLFAGPCSSRLLPVDNHQKAAGGQDPDPGELQIQVGGDLQDYR